MNYGPVRTRSASIRETRANDPNAQSTGFLLYQTVQESILHRSSATRLVMLDSAAILALTLRRLRPRIHPLELLASLSP